MGTLTGGDKLQAHLERIAKRVAEGKAVQVGFLEGATYPDGTSVPMVAAIQEFGAPAKGIPPRPFMRNTIAEHKGEWGEALAAALKAADYNVEKALAHMGEVIASQVRDSITELTSPALSPITIMLRKMRAQNPALVVTAATLAEAARRVAKGRSVAGINPKPLIDSGVLLNSVEYQVVDGSGE